MTDSSSPFPTEAQTRPLPTLSGASRSRSVVLTIALVLVGVFAALAILVMSAAVFLVTAVLLLPASLTAPGHDMRAQRPWAGGGEIYSGSNACSTAGLGTFRGSWAFLTASHCVDGTLGAEVTDRWGNSVGTVSWVDDTNDLAVVTIAGQEEVRPEHALAWTGPPGGFSAVPVGGALSAPPREGAADVWVSGMQLGAVGGPDVRVLGTAFFMHDRGALQGWEVGGQSGPISVRGTSGGGVYKERNGRWFLWGVAVLSPPEGPFLACDTSMGRYEDCTSSVYATSIASAVAAGFSVASYPGSARIPPG